MGASSAMDQDMRRRPETIIIRLRMVMLSHVLSMGRAYTRG
ncbi:hypothetical protein JOF53_004617 [Crossiella equi]|uniref:Uncharacterized protein n=1 Tax=Crossiella equi TaxID=130796 RepID=A0ABS5AGQ0_9PSEU|nr:hypothetical protein [Crossiella equi]